MIRVAVCDDEREIVQQITDLLLFLQEQFNEELYIDQYIAGKELCNSLKDGKKYDLIFLDISMPETNGVQVGKLIREELGDNITQIVFVSSDSRYAMELFQVQPLDFLIKPVDGEKIKRIVKLACKVLDNGRQIFKYDIGGESYREELSHIIYFESEARKIIMHTIEGEKCFYGKLNDVYNKIKGYGFVNIHKSYVINNLHVKICRKESVLMENGVELPISRSRREEVRHICSIY